MSTIKVDTLQTRSGNTAAVTGAGFVATDQIKGNTTATTVTLPTTTNIGATAIVSASAGSATIIAEGGTVTTNLQQGLAKAWVCLNGTGTAAIRDSFNLTSITDNATADYTATYANDFANDGYAPVASVVGATNADGFAVGSIGGSGTFHPAGSTRCRAFYHSGSVADPDFLQVIAAGDLA